LYQCKPGDSRKLGRPKIRWNQNVIMELQSKGNIGLKIERIISLIV
jgi:hypothetical protein